MDKEHIVHEIHRLANGGKAPGFKLFASETGIRRHQWEKYWARGGDALAEAGCSANDWGVTHGDDHLLGKMIDLVQRLGRVPANSDLRFESANEPTFPAARTIARRWNKAELIPALQAYCDARPELSEAAAIVKASPPPVQSKKISIQKPKEIGRDRYVYLLQSGKKYKIGLAIDPLSRASAIQGMTPDGLVIEHLIRTDDPRGIEEYWHKRFADRRGNGEWFALSAADVAAFKRRKFM